jgi:uncharacterized protein YydD (DUF2326 family)
MLVELRCDKFKSYGKTRPPIRFGKGLNAVQGSPTGSNSIGKSTFLMIIDFCLGGDDYLLKSTDVQAEVGAHTIEFMFRFSGKEYRFSRNTIEAAVIRVCDEKYQPTGEEYTLEKYREWLKEQYHITLPNLSFRDMAGRYIRVYGRENLSEKRPLYYVYGESEEASLTSLIKLFNLFTVISDLREEEKRCKYKKSATLKAQKFNLVPSVNKTRVKQNEKEIAKLELLLRNLEGANEKQQMKTLGIGSEEADKVLELKKLVTAARRRRSKLKSRLSAVENNMGFRAENGFKSPSSSSFRAFSDFFPEANIRKIEQIEAFHSQLQEVLHAEFAEAKAELAALVELADAEIERLEKEIINSGVPAKMSKARLEQYADTAERIRALRRENAAYTELADLKENAKFLAKQLVALLSEQLAFIQQAINACMAKINGFIYDDSKIAPNIALSDDGKPYKFTTPKDTGTGVQYKGLLVFDLSILELTPLPLLVHDSVLFNNIAHEPLEKIFEWYMNSDKQIFVAIDKAGTYTPKMQDIIRATTVLELSDGGNELFGRPWNVKQPSAPTVITEKEADSDEVE